MTVQRVVAALGFAVAAAACGDNLEIEAEQDDLLEPPPPGEGVQIRMRSALDAGTETERCMFWVVPPGGLNMHRQEIRYTPGSHHVLLMTTSYESIPGVNVRGEAVDTNGVFECKNGPSADWNITGIAGGSQKFDGRPNVEDLPDDVAVKLAEGSVLLVNAHYLNTADETLDTDIRINIHTIPDRQVAVEAGFLFMYNIFIRVPAQGEASARMMCPVKQDMTLVNAQSHMHKRGVGYLANLVDQTGQNPRELYTTDNWDEVEARFMSPHMQLKAGEMIDFRCDYRNTGTTNIMQGSRSTDEMCLFMGLYYPKDSATEYCGLGTWATRYLGGVWVGSGTATCQQTVGCVATAKPRTEDGGDSLYGCVINSCPKAALQTSNAVRCQITKAYGQCGQTCTDDPAGCGACVQTKCATELTACVQASCN